MTRSGYSQYPRRIPQQARNTAHVAYAERVTGERERSVNIAHRYGYLREIEHPVTIRLRAHADITPVRKEARIASCPSCLGFVNAGGPFLVPAARSAIGDALKGQAGRGKD